ncbi:MAG: polysaccharide deacetylase [Thermodesulfobacteriota bacterium]
MTRPPVPLWQAPPADLLPRLQALLAAVARRPAAAPVAVFFRADDIGVPGRNLARLLATFAGHHVPLALAVVPAWLTSRRWQEIRALVAGVDPDLWCWHQHGWRHRNHQPAGRKEEFGAARPEAKLRADLAKGRQRLAGILGEAFFPAFTPPWNRMSETALALLPGLGLPVLSRWQGALPPAQPGVTELPVRVDLHTRRQSEPAAAAAILLEELAQGLAADRCGIMIHHQRMNQAAFVFLDALLAGLARLPGVRLVHFGHLLPEGWTSPTAPV